MRWDGIPRSFEDWLQHFDKRISRLERGRAPSGGGGSTNTIRSGAGAPDPGLGSDGDFYIDTTADEIYGPKTAGAWGSPTALGGTAGLDGLSVLSGAGPPDPGDGANGEFYIDTTAWDIYGPKAAGVWGSGTSLVGPTGAAGNTILNGTTAPGAGLGDDGDFYFRTTTGELYGPKTAGAWGSPVLLRGVLLLENGASVPAGTPAGVVVYEKDV